MFLKPLYLTGVRTKKDQKSNEKILDSTREQLLSQEGLMFEGGTPATPEAINSIFPAMQIGMEMEKNQEKYTPKNIEKPETGRYHMEYVVNFTWDDEACVWVATSNDIPGLVLESGSFDALLERVRIAVPELLSLNSTPNLPIFLSFLSERHERMFL